MYPQIFIQVQNVKVGFRVLLSPQEKEQLGQPDLGKYREVEHNLFPEKWEPEYAGETGPN